MKTRLEHQYNQIPAVALTPDCPNCRMEFQLDAEEQKSPEEQQRELVSRVIME